MITLKEHPIEIQDLVVELFKSEFFRYHIYQSGVPGQSYPKIDFTDSICNLLDWERTPQGTSFWGYVNRGLYENAKGLGHWPTEIKLIDNYQIH